MCSQVDAKQSTLKPNPRILVLLATPTGHCDSSNFTRMWLHSNTFRDLIMLIMKFLDEENYKRTLQALELESKTFFNVNRFEEIIINGEWEMADKYLSAFTNMDDNRYSRKLFFELRKQKYYETLGRNDHTGAVSIFWKDLKVFSVFPHRFVGELDKLFALKDSRENEQLSCYANTTSARAKLLYIVKVLVKRNCKLQDKVVFPSVNKAALLSLIGLICPNAQKEKRNIKEELIYLILQFLDEEGFKETLHKLEQESKIFFNINYFGECINNREWDEAEKYLSAFTKIDDNIYSAKIFTEMRRQVDRRGNLLPEHTATDYLCDNFKMLVEKNPILQDKLKFPSMEISRLVKIIKLAMGWWIPYCVHNMPNDHKGAISLKDIPTVPYLCHAPSFVVDRSYKKKRFLTATSGGVHGLDKGSFCEGQMLPSFCEGQMLPVTP